MTKKPGGRFKCPACPQRVGITIKRGAWYWAPHARDGEPNGETCRLSGKRMA